MNFSQFHEVLRKFVGVFVERMYPFDKPEFSESRDTVLGELKVSLTIDPKQKVSKYESVASGERIYYAPYRVEVLHPVLFYRYRHGPTVPVCGIGTSEEEAVAVCLEQVCIALKKLYDAKVTESDAADSYAEAIETASKEAKFSTVVLLVVLLVDLAHLFEVGLSFPQTPTVRNGSWAFVSLPPEGNMTRNLLTPEFLAKYDELPGLETLLQRAVFLSKIAQPEDEGRWHNCIRRVVEGNCARDGGVQREEAEQLYDAMFHCRILPSGRGLRVTGRENMPASSVNNCWGVGFKKLSDLPWGLDQLMCGGGVGFSLLEIDKLPVVQEGSGGITIRCNRYHADYNDVNPDTSFLEMGTYFVPDTRAGWVDVYAKVLTRAFSGKNIHVDVSQVRENGAILHTFGGTASGPAPLAKMLRETYRIIRGAAGRKLTSVEWLHVITHMGVCVSSGGGRRSAIWVGSHPDDVEFINAKKDTSALYSNLYASNNSIVFTSPEQWERMTDDEWKELAKSMLFRGDPGISSLWRMRQDNDPLVTAANPCFSPETLIKTRQGHFQIKDLVGKTVDVWDGNSWRNVTTFQKTGENQNILKITLSNGSFVRVTPNHKIVLHGVHEMIEARHLQVGSFLQIDTTEAHVVGFNEVISIETDGFEAEVFCLVTNDPDRVALSNGIIIGRCQEIPTEDRESCCISDGFPSNWENTDDTAACKYLRLLTRFTLRQRLVELDDAEAEAVRVKNMRIGVGISGIVDLENPLDVSTSTMWYATVRQEASRYAEELGINVPIKVTTVKPSGTVSLLANTSAGFHAAFAPYYIRRIDIEENSPLCEALKEACVPHEPSVWRAKTLSFSFPVKRNAQVYESTETLETQFARLRLMQDYWSDNSVSCTIKANPDEYEKLATLLKEHVPHLKTISCMGRSAENFKQAPYEEISEERYNEMYDSMIHAHPLTYGGGSDYAECEGGACPI